MPESAVGLYQPRSGMTGLNLQYAQPPQHFGSVYGIPDTLLEAQSETIVTAVDWNLEFSYGHGRRVLAEDSPGAYAQPGCLNTQRPKPEPRRSLQRWGSGEHDCLCDAASPSTPQRGLEGNSCHCHVTGHHSRLPHGGIWADCTGSRP